MPAANPNGTHGSFRDRVLAVIGNNWANVTKIQHETGLEIKRIRGVVNAPGVRDRIERRTVDGNAEYRLREESKADD